MEDKETIGSKIKVLRKTRGLTQDQLAKMLGLQRATISNYEIGRRSPHLTDLKNIANALGVSLEYFAVEDEDIYNLISRAKLLFENKEVEPMKKAHIYKEIMRLYLENEKGV